MKLLKILLSLILFSALSSSFAYADNYDFAVSVPISSEGVEEGSLVSYVDGEYVLSIEAYDESLFGVVATNPSLYLEDRNLDQSALVGSRGSMSVRVSTKNGAIAPGDYLTSSELPGVAQKADRSGRVIGIALEEYTSEDPNEIGLVGAFVDIKANLRQESLSENLLTVVSDGLSSAFLTPLASLRYMMALIVTAITFAIAFTSFSRLTSRGVEALGRNPLAGTSIKSVIVFNFLLTFVIIASGLAIAYLILVL